MLYWWQTLESARFHLSALTAIISVETEMEHSKVNYSKRNNSQNLSWFKCRWSNIGWLQLDWNGVGGSTVDRPKRSLLRLRMGFDDKGVFSILFHSWQFHACGTHHRGVSTRRTVKDGVPWFLYFSVFPFSRPPHTIVVGGPPGCS